MITGDLDRMESAEIKSLAEGVRSGESVSVARAITLVENRGQGHQELLRALYPHTGRAHIVGFTGSPGSGKSTLVNQLADQVYDQESTLGIVAVDPSSPYSGGSVLGDRIRFERSSREDVFFRSMSSGGTTGGLARSTNDVLRILDAAGYDPLFVETVGAGQSEVEVVRTADTVLVLVDPSAGDDVQMLKAGILEIGSIYVVNKMDRQGADRTVRDVKQMVRRAGSSSDTGNGWTPPVVKTNALTGENVSELGERIQSHREYLRESGRGEQVRRQRRIEEVKKILLEKLNDRVNQLVEEQFSKENPIDDSSDPYRQAEDLITELPDDI